MGVLDKIDWNILNIYIENNLIIANKHPEYDIWILNYSPKVQSKRLWDEYTLSCSGLIIDKDGLILARPFQKFLDVNESDDYIDNSLDYEVFDMIDGVMIILFYYKPRMIWVLASKDSFISEQIIEAKKIIDINTYDILNVDYTYLFEIIHPENRVVVDFGDLKDIVLIAVINTETNSELSYSNIHRFYSKHFTIVEKFTFNDIVNIEDLCLFEQNNKKGFVVKFSNNHRIKIEFKEYVKLNSILKNISNVTVWEHLTNAFDFNSFYHKIPLEYHAWLKNIINELQNEYNEIERLSLKEFVRIYYINDIINRNEFALEANKTKYNSILFKLYEKKAYDSLIWKMIKPEKTEPFEN